MKRMVSRDRERKKLAELAREYGAMGYQVFAELPEFESPALVDGIRPDLVAKRGDETVIIEVKTSGSLQDSKDTVEHLARYAEKVPGTRFDLVLTNPKPQSSVPVRIKALQDELKTIQDGFLADVSEALKQNKTDLVVILASRLLEGLLVRAAAKKEVYIPRTERTLAVLSRKLASEKIVSQSVVEFANQLQQQRNAIVHGRAIISTEDAIDIYQKLTRLLKQW